jgi:hypothetical protein
MRPLTDSEREIASRYFNLLWSTVARYKNLVAALGGFEEALGHCLHKYLRCCQKFDPNRGLQFSAPLNKYVYRALTAAVTRKVGRLELFTGDFYGASFCAPPEDPLVEQIQWIEDQLRSLDQRTRQIIINRYGLLGEPQVPIKETADKLLITERRVKQLLEAGLRKIRRLHLGTPE